MKVKYPNVTYRLGDVKDKPSLVRNLYEFKPTVVINTAAVKTVWVCQDNSYESVQTNIIGHQNLIDAIQECNYKIPLKTLVFISTDKACKPVNVYGMSKAIAEQLYVNFAKQQSDVKVVMARYGNVLNSTGSIIPVFTKKIKDGVKSLPITHFGMTRFLLTLEQAIDLIEWAYFHKDSHGKIAIPKIESLKIIDLAKAIADDSSTEEISGTQPDGAKGVVVDLDFRQVVYSAEVGSEDHVCAECGFTTSDNSEYIDHLNSHEV